MLRVYTAPSCQSCRKVKKYFNDFNIDYVEKNILVTPLTKEEIYKMLIYSENGFDDIISTRSKIIKDEGLNIDDMTISEVIDFIIENPTILKRPIIVRGEEIQVGYNDDDISLFLPEELRHLDCDFCPKKNEECKYITAMKELKCANN